MFLQTGAKIKSRFPGRSGPQRPLVVLAVSIVSVWAGPGSSACVKLRWGLYPTCGGLLWH